MFTESLRTQRQCRDGGDDDGDYDAKRESSSSRINLRDEFNILKLGTTNIYLALCNPGVEEYFASAPSNFLL